MGAAILQKLSRAWCAALDLVFPRTCASCARVLIEPDGAHLCGRCRGELPLIDPQNACRRCGLPLGPFSVDHENNFCEGCQTLRFAGFRRAIAAGTYEGSLRNAICRFKYGRRPYLSRMLGELLAERLERELKEIHLDAVISVPLHPSRRRQRTFDQAELLAEVVSSRLGLPFLRGVLERTKPTPTLTQQSREERARTVEGVFKVRRPEQVRGKKLLLIDDVMTTGATCSECARALKTSGAEGVLVAVLARTP